MPVDLPQQLYGGKCDTLFGPAGANLRRRRERLPDLERPGLLRLTATCDATVGHCAISCNNTCSLVGTTQCSGVQVQICNVDSNGCLNWTSPADCPRLSELQLGL